MSESPSEQAELHRRLMSAIYLQGYLAAMFHLDPDTATGEQVLALVLEKINAAKNVQKTRDNNV